jgi:hypothetical protein
LEVTNWQSSFECGLRCSVLVSTYPMAAVGTGVKRGNWRTAWSYRPPRPSPPAFLPPALHPPPPTTAWSRRHPQGVVGKPAAGRIPSVPPVGGWSRRLGASSRPQIRRWDRRQCHMPDFWSTGRARNPLNVSVATFCAADVISMHQTPPGMVRGVSGVTRGRFYTY